MLTRKIAFSSGFEYFRAMKKTSFTNWSYEVHSRHFGLRNQFPEKLLLAWLDETSADYFRHRRCYEFAEVLSCSLDSHARGKTTWLTVGDGRLGLDSARIKKFHFKKVLPTDISPHLLIQGKEWKVIDKFQIENAENLSFKDKSFDWIFCKESLHHFPRPFQALYEMLRVSRKGVVIIEPNDAAFDLTTGRLSKLPLGILKIIRQLGFSRIFSSQPQWESTGNYFYSFGRRELEKIAYGLNLPCIAFKGLNDHYLEGCEFEPANYDVSEIFREMSNIIKEKNKLMELRLREPDLLMSVFFKENPPPPLMTKLLLQSWEVKYLSQSPQFK